MSPVILLEAFWASVNETLDQITQRLGEGAVLPAGLTDGDPRRSP
jgi:hypothetical protein